MHGSGEEPVNLRRGSRVSRFEKPSAPIQIHANQPPCDTALVKGFFLGLVLIVVVVISVLSVRPGGLRSQLRNVARRLRLALILSGIYLAVSTVLRLALPDNTATEAAMVAIGAALGITFLILGQDRQYDRR